MRKSTELVRFFVSPQGNDRWSGTLASPNRSRTDGPFATIERAQHAVREFKRNTKLAPTKMPRWWWDPNRPPLQHKGEPPVPVRIELRGGIYELSKPIIFTARDSGGPLRFDEMIKPTATRREVTYAAYRGETPILSGGRRVGGWKETTVHGRRAWVTHLPEVARGRWNFTQLWVNGRRAPRTRLPKEGFFRIEKLLGDVFFGHTAKDFFTGQDRFRFAAGDLEKWRNIHDVEFVALHFWIESRVPFRSIDPKRREARLQWRPRMRLTDDHTRRPTQYYVENVFEAMTEPGQWYLDRSRGDLYYLPRRGEKIESTEIIGPRLNRLMILEGVHDVDFEGLTFSYSEWTPGDEAHTATPQAACHIPGTISCENARDCAIRHCEISHIGSYGIETIDASRDIEIVGNRITDLAAGGVKVWHTPLTGATRPTDGGSGGDKTFLHGCREIIISDNEISDGGHRWRQAVGVLVGKCSSNQILHNHIHDFDYSGISVGWTWGYEPNHADANVIENNHVHHIGRGVLSDMGGIYILGLSPGTRVRGNLVHNVDSRGYGGWGIYLDGGCTDALVENNIVYRTKSQGFHQSCGRENIVRNNIFALGREGQIARAVVEPHLSFDFINNIVYGSNGGTILGGNWHRAQANMDHNVYFDTKTTQLRFAKHTWRKWRRDADAHSIVTDPKFVNPSKGDFRLRPNSPAIRAGFVPITLNVGPRRES